MEFNIKINSFQSTPDSFSTFDYKKLKVSKYRYLNDKNSVICKNGNLEFSYNHIYDHFFFSKYVDEKYLQNFYSKKWLKKKDNASLYNRILNKLYFYKYNSYLNKIFDQKIKEILKYLNYNSSVLDIGGGDGTFLKKLSKNIKIGYNFEASSYNKIKKSNNIDFIYGNFQKIKKIIKPKSLDLIILHHSLEHIKNHKELFKTVNLLLNEKGILVVAVPDNENIDLLNSCLFIPHLHNFSKKSLQHVLNKNNFYIEKFIDYKINEIFFICSKNKKKIKFKSLSLKKHFKNYRRIFKMQKFKNQIRISSYPKKLSKKTNFLSRVFYGSFKSNNKTNNYIYLNNKKNKSYILLK